MHLHLPPTAWSPTKQQLNTKSFLVVEFLSPRFSLSCDSDSNRQMLFSKVLWPIWTASTSRKAVLRNSAEGELWNFAKFIISTLKGHHHIPGVMIENWDRKAFQKLLWGTIASKPFSFSKSLNTMKKMIYAPFLPDLHSISIADEPYQFSSSTFGKTYQLRRTEHNRK